MIADHETNIVYISALLPEAFPSVADALKTALGSSLRTIPNTKDIWCRDYMPIQLDLDRFVQFRYVPDYLENDPALRTDDAARLLDLTTNAIRSDLVIDGGNVVRWNDTVILTEKVYKKISLSRLDLRREIKRLLEVDQVVMIPKEPYEKIGHSDGMVRFVDEKTLLVSDYSRAKSDIGNRLAAVLKRKGFQTISFPYCPTGKVKNGIDSAEGVYINFLQINTMIFCPTFGQHEDDVALSILGRCFPSQRIIPVPSTDLAEEGGVLNCITWNIKGD